MPGQRLFFLFLSTANEISTITLVCVVGIGFVLGLKRLKETTAPRIRLLPRSLSTFLDKYLFLPALIGKRRIQKLPYSMGYVPQRSMTLMLVIYLALNVVFCAVSYPLSTNNTWFLTSNKQQMAYIGNRLGVLSVANIALATMFSGRNSVLLYITGRSRTDIITFHRWAGRVAAIEAIAHGAIYWSNTNQYGTNMFKSAAGISYLGCTSSYWTLGILAMVMLILMVIFSIPPIRTRWYEIFLFLHVGLSIIALVSLFYHLVDRYGRAYGYEVWLYIAFAVWASDRIFRVCRLVILNWRPILRRRPSAQVELLPGNQFLKVTVWPSVRWHYCPGQYCFLYFPTLPFYLESHPFTIALWSNGPAKSLDKHSSQLSQDVSASDISTNRSPDVELQPVGHGTKQEIPADRQSDASCLSFIIRPGTGMTGRLYSRLLKQAAPVHIPVLLEGPYGFESTAFKDADVLLAFAGGIGITSILGYLNAYLSSASNTGGRDGSIKLKGMRAQRMVIRWAVRESSLVEAIVPQIPGELLLRNHNMDTIISCGQRGDPRLDFRGILREEIQGSSGYSKFAIVVCGPGRMADEIRSNVVELKEIDNGRVELIEEVFAW